MRVICRLNTGKALRQKPLPPKYFTAFRGETEETVFHVSIGKEYEVFAMALWQSVIIVLVLDETKKPNWYSIELFSVADGRLPGDWMFNSLANDERGVEAIWGYEAMVSDPRHYEALIERDRNALDIFEQERRRHQQITAS
jgi:hypothetical protein